MSQNSKKKSTVPKPKTPVQPAKTQKRFLSLISENNLPWIVIVITFLLIFIIFHKFLLGNAFYLFKDIGSDTLNTFYPHFIHVNQYMKTDGFPLWSFAQGMGQNIQSISVNDPFYFIIYLFFPNNIAYGIIWMEMIKILLTAIISLYIFKSWKLQPVNQLIGALLITFSSFMIIGGGWYIFSTEVVFFTLLLLGFERIFQQKSWYIFPLALALIAANQPFNLYFYGLFLILYIILRLFTENQLSLRIIISLAGRLFALSLLGLLISSFFFLSSLQQILDSPRVSGSAGYFNLLQNTPMFATGSEIHNTTAILRFFSTDILGYGTGFNGWNNFLEAPLFYIGILPLVLMPQIHASRNIKKNIPYLVLLFLFIFPVIFPFWRYTFWLFTGDYYRGLSFFLGLSFLFMTLISLDNIVKGQKINLLVLGITAILLLGLLYFPFNNIERLINKDAQALARNFIIIYTLVIGLASWKSFRTYLPQALLLLIVIELGIVYYKSIEKRSVVSKSEHKQKTGYNDYSVDAMSFIHSIDNGFFRTHKSFSSSPSIHDSYNDAKVQNYYSSRVYGSFNQSYYIRFLEEVGIIQKGNEMQSRWVNGLIERPLLQTWASSKYLLFKGDARHLSTFGYDSLTQKGDVKVFRNKYFLPLGFGYDMYITAEDFRKLSPLNKDLLLLSAFVADDQDIHNLHGFKRFEIRDTLSKYDFPDYFRFADSRKADTLSLTFFSQNKIKGTITVDSTRMLFLSIPYDKGWHARLNGKEVALHICNFGFIGIPLNPGKYTLELNFRPPFYILSLLATISGIIIFLLLIALPYLKSRKTVTGNNQVSSSETNGNKSGT